MLRIRSQMVRLLKRQISLLQPACGETSGSSNQEKILTEARVLLYSRTSMRLRPSFKSLLLARSVPASCRSTFTTLCLLTSASLTSVYTLLWAQLTETLRVISMLMVIYEQVAENSLFKTSPIGWSIWLMMLCRNMLKTMASTRQAISCHILTSRTT